MSESNPPLKAEEKHSIKKLKSQSLPKLPLTAAPVVVKALSQKDQLKVLCACMVGIANKWARPETSWQKASIWVDDLWRQQGFPEV